VTLTSISSTFTNYSSDESGTTSYNPSGGGGQSSDEGGSYLMRPIANAFSLALDGVDLPANPALGGVDESGNPLNSGSSNNWWEQAQAIRWQGPAGVTTTALAPAEKAPLGLAPADVATPAPAAYISWGESDPHQTTGNGNPQSSQGSTDESGQSGPNSSTAQNLPVGGSSIAAVALGPLAAQAEVPAVAAVPVQAKASVYDPTVSAANFSRGVSAQWDADRRAVMEDVHQQYGQFKAQVAQECRFQIEREEYNPNGDRFITFTFDEQSARQEWLHQSHASLESLGRLYQLSGQQALIDTRGDVVDLALRGGVAKLEGKAPSGQVMSDEGDIVKLDAYLKSDMNQVLILKFGQGPIEPAHSAVALEQLRKYGDARLEKFNRLQQALAHVQSDYAQAKARALNDSAGPGWSDVKVQVPTYDRQTEADSSFLTGYQTETQRQFSSQAFSQWYGGQWDRTENTISNGAFARIYGTEIDYIAQGHYNVNGDYSGDVAASKFQIKLGEETLTLRLEGNRIEQEFVITLDLNAAPDLHNNEAVGWNPFVGWTTPAENIDEGTDWAFTIASIIVIAVVSYFSAGALSGEAIAFFSVAEGSLAAAAITGAIAGGTGALTSGLINDNLSWQGVLKGMVFGAVGGAANFAVGELAQASGAATYTQVLQDGGASVQNVPDIGVTGGGQVQQAFDPSRGLTVSDASDSLKAAADLAGSRTFGAISTGGRVLIGGGLNQAFDGAISAGATSYIGRVLGAGLSSELVNQRGGRGDLAFLNAVVDATEATIKPSNSDSVIFAQGPDESAAETERLGRQSLAVDAAINVPAPNPVAEPLMSPANPDVVGVPNQPSAQTEEPSRNVPPTLPVSPETSPVRVNDAQNASLPVAGVGNLPGSALDVETFYEGRLTYALKRDESGSLMATYNASDKNYATLTLSDGHALVRGPDGLLKLVSADDAKTQGLKVIATAGQTLVIGTGANSTMVLAAGSSPSMISAATATTVALGQRLALGAAAEGAGLIAGESMAGLVGNTLPRSLGALGLLLVSGNAFAPDTQTQVLSDGLRLVTPVSQTQGFVEIRATDEQGKEQWLRVAGQFDRSQAQQLADAMQTTSVLSPEEASRLMGSSITPIPPRLDGSPPPLIAVQPQDQITPGYEAVVPIGPQVETLPSAPQVTIEDLLTDKRNSTEQKRFRNNLIDEEQRQNPNFDPSRYQAHHIVPLTEYPEMSDLRDRLTGWGIDLNDSANGVLLPSKADVGPGTIHSDTQKYDVYRLEIERRFEGVNTRGEAMDMLTQIKNELRNGTFVPPKNNK
jgi:A nuclease family of the HNH/ENDO VII superfamily with conserved AHH